MGVQDFIGILAGCPELSTAIRLEIEEMDNEGITEKYKTKVELAE